MALPVEPTATDVEAERQAAREALAGREIEKNVRKSKVYEVVTRLEGGGAQTINFETDPGYKVGDRVRIEAGTLVRN